MLIVLPVTVCFGLWNYFLFIIIFLIHLLKWTMQTIIRSIRWSVLRKINKKMFMVRRTNSRANAYMRYFVRAYTHLFTDSRNKKIIIESNWNFFFCSIWFVDRFIRNNRNFFVRKNQYLMKRYAHKHFFKTLYIYTPDLLYLDMLGNASFHYSSSLHSLLDLKSFSTAAGRRLHRSFADWWETLHFWRDLQQSVECHAFAHIQFASFPVYLEDTNKCIETSITTQMLPFPAPFEF